MTDVAAITLTSLEFRVLQRVASGEDPWKTILGKSQRVHSGAIGRLQRHGFVQLDPEARYHWSLTDEGRRWLASERTP